ncbi:MAG: substrate-binding domain-containing protein [Epsilonproteobacteria bacterium]|nr:substrate-binding domain-containing protein [Campylobacterota bacterium]
MRLFKAFFSLLLLGISLHAAEPSKRIAYLVSDIRIPFWQIMSRGIESKAARLGYSVEIYSADNSLKRELENTAAAIAKRVDAIVVSPTSSSACTTILKLAKAANIPVVIADIGTDGGEYLTYIASDNYSGAYGLGKILAEAMKKRNYQEGRVGIVAIPQKRLNGQARTAGFMKALEEEGIKGADIKQQADFSYKETYDFSIELIDRYPDLRALWLQGSDRYQAALDAIKKSGRDVLLICFDAEPEFMELIPKGILAGAGMQQPFLMGERSIEKIEKHFLGQEVRKELLVPVLAVSTENIAKNTPIIKRNVLGILH